MYSFDAAGHANAWLEVQVEDLIGTAVLLVVVDEGWARAEEGLGVVLGGGDEVGEEGRRSARGTVGLASEELSVGLGVGDSPPVGDAAVGAADAGRDGRRRGHHPAWPLLLLVLVIDGPAVVVVLEAEGATGQHIDVRPTRLDDVLDAPVRLEEVGTVVVGVVERVGRP